jgi:hypothetical protein
MRLAATEPVEAHPTAANDSPAFLPTWRASTEWPMPNDQKWLNQDELADVGSLSLGAC